MRFHFWHTALSLFFAALAVVGYLWLSATGPLSGFVPARDFILMALAIQRLVRLFTYDAITAFIRNWFAGADPRTFRGALGTLINCPWCTGLWFSLLVVFCYFMWPVASWYAILVLALASVASILQITANYVGWSAEGKKRECESIPLPR